MDRCFVLLEDPDLAAWIDESERSHAINECLALVTIVPRGMWDPTVARLPTDGIGLLVLDGLLMRRVGIDGRWGAELLGEGDLLRPWQPHEARDTLPHSTGWQVLTEARLAILDTRATAMMSRYPALMGAITDRSVRRARRLALLTAIVHHPRIEVRLHMLLWQLASRWGRVRPDGVMVPLRLSHAILSDLVAAQRPSVTSALRKLSDRGLVTSLREGWLLRGGPPGELLELGDESVPDGGQVPSGTRSR